MLTNSPLIVIGYRGAEPSIMDSLLGKNIKRTQNFKNEIYWCVLEGEAAPSQCRDAAQGGGKRNFRLLEISGSDELIGAVN